jgi:hypothetical protein
MEQKITPMLVIKTIKEINCESLSMLDTKFD